MKTSPLCARLLLPFMMVQTVQMVVSCSSGGSGDNSSGGGANGQLFSAVLQLDTSRPPSSPDGTLLLADMPNTVTMSGDIARSVAFRFSTEGRSSLSMSNSQIKTTNCSRLVDVRYQVHKWQGKDQLGQVIGELGLTNSVEVPTAGDYVLVFGSKESNVCEQVAVGFAVQKALLETPSVPETDPGRDPDVGRGVLREKELSDDRVLRVFARSPVDGVCRPVYERKMFELKENYARWQVWFKEDGEFFDRPLSWRTSRAGNEVLELTVQLFRPSTSNIETVVNATFIRQPQDPVDWKSSIVNLLQDNAAALSFAFDSACATSDRPLLAIFRVTDDIPGYQPSLQLKAFPWLLSENSLSDSSLPDVKVSYAWSADDEGVDPQLEWRIQGSFDVLKLQSEVKKDRVSAIEWRLGLNDPGRPDTRRPLTGWQSLSTLDMLDDGKLDIHLRQQNGVIPALQIKELLTSQRNLVMWLRLVAEPAAADVAWSKKSTFMIEIGKWCRSTYAGTPESERIDKQLFRDLLNPDRRPDNKAKLGCAFPQQQLP